ncbi:MAG TPA: hypothetical protein PLL06_11230 [Acidobacteriota bacterium]|nr:hypothetical protein [Acidobacteriota bacterium]
MLTVEPLFGLCNRMQALSSVLSLAEDLKQPVTVIWSLNPELNCRFDALFEIPQAVVELRQTRREHWRYYTGPSISIGTPESNDPNFLKNLPGSRWFFDQTQPVTRENLIYRCLAPARYLNKLLFYHYGFDRVVYEFEVSNLLWKKFDFRTLASHPTLYFRAWQFFHSSDSSPAAQFRLVAELRDRVAAETAHFSDYTVGLHIRRTDHVRAIANSTTEKFIAAIQAEIDQHSSARFFLATDSPEEETTLRRLFPDRILTYQKRTLDRNSPEGIQDAVVDLYCLARTQKILGSIGSSFSRTASRLGDCPLTMVD